MRPEEQIEGAIERADLFVTMDEQAAHRRRDIGAAADADRFERAHRVEHPAVMDLEPCLTQQRVRIAAR